MPDINMSQRHPNPAVEQLLGMKLEGGWEVTQQISVTDSTGGAFSRGYLLKNADGRDGFLKAMDFSSAALADDPVLELEAMTRAFLFEVDLLERCQRHDRVVTAVGHGQMRVGPGIDGLVPYVIFARAQGDIRVQRDAVFDFDTAWSLRSLHQIAVGLKQLHSAGIAHQDLKPSNVLVFGPKDAKVADLGTASDRGRTSANDQKAVLGDAAYAPPELHYGHFYPDWEGRRAGDLYLLGSMIPFLFAGFSMTHLLINNLATEHTARQWTGSYIDVLPYLIAAFDDAVRLAQTAMPAECRDGLVVILRELCHPDPAYRGNPQWRRTMSQYSLETYVTRLDILARRAELRLQ
jgi:serine/threonine protein kinase